jgi:hypothetical protein
MDEPHGMTTPQPLHHELHLLCQQALALLGFEPRFRGPESSPRAEDFDELSGSPIPRAAHPPRSEPHNSRAAPERVTPPSVRRQEAGTSLGAQVLPLPHQLSGDPFILEPMGNPPPEAWSDLTELLHQARWGDRQAPPSDHEARQIRDPWRAPAVCADLVLVGTKGPSEALHRRLAQAISVHICPAIWVDVSTFQSSEAAEGLLLHPANRLLVITPEALWIVSWMHSGIRQDPHGTTWKGRPAVVLDSAEELEQDPTRKRALWEGLQAWKRGL